MKKVKSTLSLLPYLILGIGLNVITTYYLYSWFMVSIFKLPAISIIESLGLTLFFNYLTFKKDHLSDDNDINKTNILIQCLKPVFALIIGFILMNLM